MYIATKQPQQKKRRIRLVSWSPSFSDDASMLSRLGAFKRTIAGTPLDTVLRLVYQHYRSLVVEHKIPIVAQRVLWDEIIAFYNKTRDYMKITEAQIAAIAPLPMELKPAPAVIIPATITQPRPPTQDYVLPQFLVYPTWCTTDFQKSTYKSWWVANRLKAFPARIDPNTNGAVPGAPGPKGYYKNGLFTTWRTPTATTPTTATHVTIPMTLSYPAWITDNYQKGVYENWWEENQGKTLARVIDTQTGAKIFTEPGPGGFYYAGEFRTWPVETTPTPTPTETTTTTTGGIIEQATGAVESVIDAVKTITTTGALASVPKTWLYLGGAGAAWLIFKSMSGGPKTGRRR
jgi:hypothetical protein